MRVGLVGLFCVLLACQSQRPELEQKRKIVSTSWRGSPQLVHGVVLLTLETLRADYLGYMGGPARTPVMDRLAQEGWNFSNCISVSMLTNPSHASIFTSLYPRDHGVYDNESGVHDGANTIASALARRDFATAAVIGFPHLNPEVANLGQGFSVVVPGARKERRAQETSQVALATLDKLDLARPFFLWVHYVDPHAPYEPPVEQSIRPLPGDRRTPLRVARRAAPRFQRTHPWFKKVFARGGAVEALLARYVAEIESLDAGLGVLLSGLRSRDLLERTALVLVGDHGENLGERGLFFHHGGLFRTTVHVPLLVRVPGRSPASLAGLVETVDVAPTILEMLGVPRWEPMRGNSLVAMVEGTRQGRRFAFSEHMLAQQVAVRSRHGTLILHRRDSRQFPRYPFVAGRREFYDTTRDPEERRRLTLPDVRATELEEALDWYLAAGLRLTARTALEQDRVSLRALGYLDNE